MLLSGMCQVVAKVRVDLGRQKSWESILSTNRVYIAAGCIFPGLDSFVLSTVWPPLIRHAAFPASPVHSLKPRGVNRSMTSEQVEMKPGTGSRAFASYVWNTKTNTTTNMVQMWSKYEFYSRGSITAHETGFEYLTMERDSGFECFSAMERA